MNARNKCGHDGCRASLVSQKLALELQDAAVNVVQRLVQPAHLGLDLHQGRLLGRRGGAFARIDDGLGRREFTYRSDLQLDTEDIGTESPFILTRWADGRLSLEAQLGYPPEAQEGLRHFFGHSHILQQALQHGEPVDVRFPGAAQEDLLGRADARSILVTPLTLGNSHLGVICLMSANRELGEDWLSFAKVMGSQIAESLELARTLSRLARSEQRYRDLIQGLYERGSENETSLD